MSDIDARQLERMATLFEAQKRAFAAEPIRPVAARREDLGKLERLVLDARPQIEDAVAADYGCRSKTETRLTEVNFVAQAARHARAHVRRWARKKGAPVSALLQPARAYIEPRAKGVVGIVSPWNYPLQLALAPLVGALAAGCRALIKPSELTPQTSELLKRLLADAYEEDQVGVVLGGPAIGEAFTRLAFDHLLFTGSTAIGRKVAAAAAENLTPLTLELGGKCPAIVTSGYPHERAAHAIAWGKLLNAGQTCIAPDYVLAPKGEARQLAAAIGDAAARFYAEPQRDPDYGAIISARHYERLEALLEEARAAGAEILQPEHDVAAMKAARKIPPTVVLDPPAGSGLMTEEIFGPILPVVSYVGLEKAIDLVNAHDRPLALYVFAKERALARRVLDATMAGGASVNTTLLHMSVEDMPFGGVGASGYGAYHGRHGFDAFTHSRATFEAPVWHPSRWAAPPYGKRARFFADWQEKGRPF